jgi:hypothetical protein
MSSPSRPNPPTPGMPSQLHKYITKNSEYLVRAGVCIEVRARDSSELRSGHAAVEQVIVARVRRRREGGHDVLVGGTPEVGDSLLLGAPEHGVLTSAVHRIESPAVDDVWA